MVRCCESDNRYQKDILKVFFKEVGTMCSNYAYHSQLNSQHDLGDIYDHVMSRKNFTLILFIQAPGYNVANGYGHNLESLIISH